MAKPATPRRPMIERTSTAILFIIAVFMVGMVVGAIIAKLRPPKQIALPPATFTTAPSTNPDRVPLSAGEHIKIVTFDPRTPDARNVKDLVIASNGEIHVPLLGELDVRGRAPGDVEQAIAQGYRERQILPDMQVQITRENPPSPSTQPTTRP